MITDKEYLAHPGHSQSRIKKILTHPKNYLNALLEDQEDEKLADEPAEASTIGDGVDILITQNEDVFFDKFHIASVEGPGGKLGDYVWNLFLHRDKPWQEAQEIAYSAAEYKHPLERVQKSFDKDGKAYYEDLLLGIGKTVISPIQHTMIVNTKHHLMNHPFTSRYFTKSSRYDLFFQYPIYFKIENTDCKSLLDLVIRDNETHTVYPIDIKTTQVSLQSWMAHFWKMRLDLQAAFYTKGLLAAGAKALGCDKLGMFEFLVANQKYPESPLIFTTDSKIIDFGRIGGITQSGRKYEGYEQALARIKWHTENDVWEYTKEQYENSGRILLDLPN